MAGRVRLAERGGQVVPATGVARAVEAAGDATELVDQDRCRMPGDAPLGDLSPVVVGEDRKVPTVLVRERLAGIVAVSDVDAQECNVVA